jgi:putative protein kinase ArgK-like GTPase of G3E family
VSAHSGKGIPALARLVSQFQQALTDSGELQRYAHNSQQAAAHTRNTHLLCAVNAQNLMRAHRHLISAHMSSSTVLCEQVHA